MGNVMEIKLFSVPTANDKNKICLDEYGRCKVGQISSRGILQL